MSEHDNPILGTDNAEPISETDTPEPIAQDDPQEDNVTDELEPGTEDETQEAEPETGLSDEGEAAPPAEESEQTTKTADLDAKIVLDDGSEKTVKDLIAGNMMQADYTRGKQEVANARKTVEADAQRIASITDAVVDHLTQMVPAEPNPQLAVTDPNAYTAQKAQYEAAMAMVSKMMELGEQPKEVTSEIDQRQHAERMQEENRLLQMAVPEVGTQEGRKKFFDSVSEIAEKIGFASDEVRSISDHRVFILAHWAQKGMDAEAAKATAQEKVKKAAPPASPRRPGQGTKQKDRKSEAMHNLTRDDSIENAVRAMMT